MAFPAKAIFCYPSVPHPLTPVFARKTAKKGFLKYAKRTQFTAPKSPQNIFSKIGNKPISPSLSLRGGTIRLSRRETTWQWRLGILLAPGKSISGPTGHSVGIKKGSTQISNTASSKREGLKPAPKIFAGLENITTGNWAPHPPNTDRRLYKLRQICW